MKDFLPLLLVGVCISALSPMHVRSASDTPHLDSETVKPVLHGRHWMAITGKPPAASAGARIFQSGGNAVDAACAMLAVVCTMHDDVGWGGETQALIYHPHEKRVIGINACGVAPSDATPEFFRQKEMNYPPGEGPLAAVTPGNPGGLMVMLAEFGQLSLKEVLQPALEMAKGYPIEEALVKKIESSKETLKEWPHSKKVFLPHLGETHEAPWPGEIFRQPDLHSTLKKLVETEQQALKEGKNRKEAIYAAYDRFYRGDIAREFVRASQELGGLHRLEDLANWKVHIEEPVFTRYKGIDVYKLTTWTQGPVMLQTLNLLEPLDVKTMGYNSARYIHALYQCMNLAYADRDFYYGDPYSPPQEPIQGLLSKEYAEKRRRQIDWDQNNPEVKPGNPYPFEGKENPYSDWLQEDEPQRAENEEELETHFNRAQFEKDFRAGTTSIQAADAQGWAVSVTPSGGWIPACIAGETGIGMSQRMQSFVLDPKENPFNVVSPGKRPRVTLTPSIALKDGKPFLCFSVQGGDTQDQNLLQFFLNVVEFGMNVQEACESANITSYQMHSSFGQHQARPGRLTLNREIPPWVRKELRRMGYSLNFSGKTSGPITAIYFDQQHGTLWGGASDYGEDYGIGW